MYEKPQEVVDREAANTKLFLEMDKESAAKSPVLADHLARNEFQDAVRLKVQSHADLHSRLSAWATAKAAYLANKETITSVAQAEVQLSRLGAYRKELANRTASGKTSLEKLGAEIHAAKYSSQYSEWVSEQQEAVSELEAGLIVQWQELAEAEKIKQSWADDDLARERFAEDWRLRADSHEEQFGLIAQWQTAKAQYLAKKESVDTVYKAKNQLGVLGAYDSEEKNLQAGAVATLKVGFVRFGPLSRFSPKRSLFVR